jgi:Uma2 family endonuclease
MAVATENRKYTVEDLWELSHQTDKRLELVKGALRELTPAGWEHGRVCARIARLLDAHASGGRYGIVLGAETGCVLEAGDEPTVRAADAAFIRLDRIGEGVPAGYAQIVPDLVVEVTSPSDTYAMVAEKVNDWLLAGAQMVWVVDPSNRQVSVHRPGKPVQVLGEEDVLSGEDVLPDFVCRVSELFAW